MHVFLSLFTVKRDFKRGLSSMDLCVAYSEKYLLKRWLYLTLNTGCSTVITLSSNSFNWHIYSRLFHGAFWYHKLHAKEDRSLRGIYCAAFIAWRLWTHRGMRVFVECRFIFIMNGRFRQNRWRNQVWKYNRDITVCYFYFVKKVRTPLGI